MYRFAIRLKYCFRTGPNPMPGNQSLEKTKNRTFVWQDPAHFWNIHHASLSEFSGSSLRVEYVKQISRTRCLYKHNASAKPVGSSTCFLAEHVFRSSLCEVWVCVASRARVSLQSAGLRGYKSPRQKRALWKHPACTLRPPYAHVHYAHLSIGTNAGERFLSSAFMHHGLFRKDGWVKLHFSCFSIWQKVPWQATT